MAPAPAASGWPSGTGDRLPSPLLHPRPQGPPHTTFPPAWEAPEPPRSRGEVCTQRLRGDRGHGHNHGQTWGDSRPRPKGPPSWVWRGRPHPPAFQTSRPQGPRSGLKCGCDSHPRCQNKATVPKALAPGSGGPKDCPFIAGTDDSRALQSIPLLSPKPGAPTAPAMATPLSPHSPRKLAQVTKARDRCL